MQSITFKVPGTTANLGPGFDTLGIALNLYNQVRVTRSSSKTIRICSPISPEQAPGALAMLNEAADLFFRRARKKPFGADLHLSGDVPIARGLGSSVTTRLGLIAGLDHLAKTSFSREDLLGMIAELEHHPDNAAPAIFGGFTVAGMQGSRVIFEKFNVSPKLRFITLIPRFEVSTEKARLLVPAQFKKADTVHNLNRAALITALFASKEYSRLKGLFEDRVHQPYRQALIPELNRVIEAGEKAGALGGWLSGSGSTIICLALEKAEQVGRAMKRELAHSDVKILRADNRGFQLC